MQHTMKSLFPVGPGLFSLPLLCLSFCAFVLLAWPRDLVGNVRQLQSNAPWHPTSNLQSLDLYGRLAHTEALGCADNTDRFHDACKRPACLSRNSHLA